MATRARRPTVKKTSAKRGRPFAAASISAPVTAVITGPCKKEYPYNKEITPGVFVDVYDVQRAFAVTSHPVAHAIKKLLMSGQRGAKDQKQDLIEARDSIERALLDLEVWR